MKNKFTTMLSLAAGVSLASAGTITAVAEETDRVSGTLSLDANSHFISYGFDVWGDGTQASEFAFNPSLELSFDLGDGWSAALGTWWDVNNKGGADPLGGNIEEVDVWAGIGYSEGIYSVSATYQEWYYGSETEKLLDIGLGLDVFLSPSITIHHRIDQGAAGGDEGTIAVFGIEKGFEVGPVSLSVPVNVAWFLTEDYHIAGGGDSGLGYASIGLQGSVPLSSLSSSLGGDWTLNGGVTYYTTNDDIVGNAESDFLTVNLGLALSF